LLQGVGFASRVSVPYCKRTLMATPRSGSHGKEYCLEKQLNVCETVQLGKIMPL
jgi:hypothetical protein